MCIESIKLFFLWCTVINAVLLFFSFFLSLIARKYVYKLHYKFFSISEEAFNTIIYCSLGLYKLLFVFFNIIPLIVLYILY